MEWYIASGFWRKFSKSSNLLKNSLWVYLSHPIPAFFLRSNQTTIPIFFLCFAILCFILQFLSESYVFSIPPFFQPCDSKGPSFDPKNFFNHAIQRDPHLIQRNTGILLRTYVENSAVPLNCCEISPNYSVCPKEELKLLLLLLFWTEEAVGRKQAFEISSGPSRVHADVSAGHMSTWRRGTGKQQHLCAATAAAAATKARCTRIGWSI